MQRSRSRESSSPSTDDEEPQDDRENKRSCHPHIDRDWWKRNLDLHSGAPRFHLGNNRETKDNTLNVDFHSSAPRFQITNNRETKATEASISGYPWSCATERSDLFVKSWNYWPESLNYNQNKTKLELNDYIFQELYMISLRLNMNENINVFNFPIIA